jgi:uncharacterized protein YndB with AHSA1/START domain
MFKQEEMGEIIDGHTLRFVRIVKHSPERVWRAITVEREISTWMRYPVKFEPREGGRAQWFGDDENRIDGKVFVFDPPRRLAFSFYTPDRKDIERGDTEWGVLWELAPYEGGCRITFTHRFLPGAVMWGVGEGWHLFIDQLLAHLDGALEGRTVYAGQEGEHPEGAQQYRAHISRQLLIWADRVGDDARESLRDGRSDDALAVIDNLALATRQLQRIATQPGVRPDYSVEGSMPVEL